jgi:hypothetical protein
VSVRRLRFPPSIGPANPAADNGIRVDPLARTVLVRVLVVSSLDVRTLARICARYLAGPEREPFLAWEYGSNMADDPQLREKGYVSCCVGVAVASEHTRKAIVDRLDPFLEGAKDRLYGAEARCIEVPTVISEPFWRLCGVGDLRGAAEGIVSDYPMRSPHWQENDHGPN